MKKLTAAERITRQIIRRLSRWSRPKAYHKFLIRGQVEAMIHHHTNPQ